MPGVIKAAQKYLAVVDLSTLNTESEDEFVTVLNAHTERLKAALPSGAQHWGAARKALNLFLRDVCYNRLLCDRYGLGTSEEWVEIPLDGLAAGALKRGAGRGKLPPWPGSINSPPR